MKRILCGLIAAVVVVGLVGCSKSQIENKGGNKNEVEIEKLNPFENIKLDLEQEIGLFSYSVSANWEKVETDDGIYYYPFEKKSDGFIYVLKQEMDTGKDIKSATDSMVQSYADAIIGGMEKSSGFEIDGEIDISKVEGYPLATFSGTASIENYIYQMQYKVILSNDNICTFAAIQMEEISKYFLDAFGKIFDSIKIQKKSNIELNELAKELGYDSVNEIEDNGVIYRTGVNNILNGDMYDVAASLCNEAKIMVTSDLNENNEETKKSLIIYIPLKNASDFVLASETLVKEESVREYKSITLVSTGTSALGTISIMWDDDNLRYTSYCMDGTEDKSIENEYNSNKLFYAFDFMTQLDDDLSNILAQYGLTS